jgi:RNA polymerase sigma factor (sigma-70 family)
MTPETFKIEVLPIKDRLFRFAKRIINNLPEAEDIVQEVFLRLWKKRDHLAEYRSVEALAMIITKNLCYDYLKSKNRLTDELTSLNDGSSGSVVELQTEFSESRNLIKELINCLPEKQRMVIQLRDIEGFEFEEIAEITGTNLNAVRVNLSRARRTIRESMVKKHNYGYIQDR